MAPPTDALSCEQAQTRGSIYLEFSALNLCYHMVVSVRIVGTTMVWYHTYIHYQRR